MLSITDLDLSGMPLRRREWLRVGGLSVVGLSLPTLLQASSAAPCRGACSAGIMWVNDHLTGMSITTATFTDGIAGAK